ncbi:protein translocase subunit SecD [bacterium]|jgi:protein-export membrane protein SecD|nr:protein translocase subunit SecD [bacterium]MDP6659553.1 protein translocase subunit SecD [Candidatus Paceibacterota bacterium]|tara:strand:- start:1937 stop:3271 length:1335 start_codon:yes stop_codon:yes gene_type:complete
MWKIRGLAILILIIGLSIGYFVFSSEKSDSEFSFKFGLDLAGGTHLVYRADTSAVNESDIRESMTALRDVIERRVNLFGVSEPIVQAERGGRLAGVVEERLIVELPGVTDTAEAVELIGQTPVLEFRLLREDVDLPPEPLDTSTIDPDSIFLPAEITGRHLKRSLLEFGQGHSGLSNEAIVVLEFNREGADLFAEITRENVGEILAIFLDGSPISTPVIQSEITGGSATITGNFAPEEARELVRNLNFGALPLPIELISTQTIGASLGGEALERGIESGLFGLGAVALFMLFWYRLPGVVAILSLSIYIAIMLAIFKLVPVTLTAAGVAGFILSIGLAVDANVLIFERMKEELKEGKNTEDSVRDGFARAWFSIRDGNSSSIITAIILFWLGTSLIEGFALTFGIGVIVSMLSAITVSRTFLYALGNYSNRGLVRALFGSGLYR